MCLAIPVEVLDILDGEWATVEMGGVKRKVHTAFVDDLKVGDYVIVHAGFIRVKVDAEEAEGTLALMKECAANASDFYGDTSRAA